MKRFLTGAAALTIAVSLHAGPPVAKEIECYCTDSQGDRVELGQVLCLRVDGRAFRARCEMALNNPFWREIEGDCLTS
ncbi:MAG: hypothetical protein AAF198_09510 [Pseudomonadota bacterium]